jgi:hypothetical protein
MHKIAIAAGAIIVAAVAHVSILASGGYAAPGAPLQVSVALGLIVGAVCVGIAWRERRWFIAACLVVALLAGESFAIIMTAERTLAARDVAVAPIRDAETARSAALARLARAESAKLASDTSALTEAAKPGCRKECRNLIEGAKADAQRELDSARAALGTAPAPRSASLLADRLGIAGWALDLLTAALASIGANGMGAALIAFGSHGRRDPQQPSQAAPAAVEIIQPNAIGPPATAHAARFALEALAPADVTTPVVRLHGAYRDWCARHGFSPLPAREIARALDELFRRAGLAVTEIDGTRHLVGAKLKSAPTRRALGPMALGAGSQLRDASEHRN